LADALLEESSAILEISKRTTPARVPDGLCQITSIRPSRGWRALDLRELWRYRELVYFLAWRDVKVRYKQTALGVAWVLIQPVVAMVIFWFFFGRLAHMPSDGLPYPLFLYAGLLPWLFFATAVTNASNSLVSNSNLVSKVYFPRLAIPLAAVGSSLVDLAIQLSVLVVLLLGFGIMPGPSLILLPPLFIFMLLTALAVGIWLSALDVQYRDVRYAIPFLIQVWLFATPVVYPASLVSEQTRGIYGLNPMAGVVEGFRWALLGRTGNPGPLLWVSIAVVLVLLISGLFYFRRMERSFADVI